LKWSILAKLCGVRLAYLSVGAGPIDSVWSRLMVRTALLFSDYTSFRDAGSRRLIEAAGFRNLGHVLPDLAHSLELPPAANREQRPRDALPTVGINPMPVYDDRYWCEPDSSRYWSYVRKMAAFTSDLFRQGYPVFLFSTQAADEATIEDVLASLDEDVKGRLDRSVIVKLSRSVDDLMKVLATADILVATRFHGILLALRSGKPVVGVCYYRKSQELLEEMGQGAYALPLDFEVENLLRSFHSLEAVTDAEVEKIRQKSAEYREALSRQYERVVVLTTHATT
jgi:polysaccharide pyruvyl transferase WcaK-like protein